MSNTRKPLELTIYPPAAPEPEDNISLEWFAWHGDRSMEQMFCEWKRLTDAELAAEVHRFPMADFGYPEDPDDYDETDWREYAARYREREAALHRFATYPHYDEEQA